MNLIERIEHLLEEEGKNPIQMKESPPLLTTILTARTTDPQSLTALQLSELATELGCPVPYLTGAHPFDDIEFLEAHKADISIHMKLFKAIHKKNQDILYGLSFHDYLWLIDQHIAKIDSKDGLSIYYKEDASIRAL